MSRLPPSRLRAERLLWLSYLVLSAYFTAPLLKSGNQLGILDWDTLLFYHASVIKSVYEYATLPFWNPWYCGGDVLWQNPQVAFLSPIYLFSLVVSLPLAMKLNILLHYLIGFCGMHLLLTRVFHVSYGPVVLLLSSLFTLAGAPALHLAVGHATFLAYFYLPWLLLCFLSAIETGALRHAVAAAAVVSLAIYNGGIHITFMAGVGLTAFSIVSALLRRDWRPVALLLAVGALAILFAAPKLVPLAVFAADPRKMDIRFFPPLPDTMSLEMVMHAFLNPFQYRRMTFGGQNYGWHEYGNYIGSFGALLIVASFLWIVVRRPLLRANWLRMSLSLTALLLLFLMVGEFGPRAPYVLFHRLPLVSQFRLPSRYTMIFLLFATAMVASVVRDIVADRLGDGKQFAAIVLVIASCFLAYRNEIHFEGAFPYAPLKSSFAFLGRPGAPALDVMTDGFGPDSPELRAIMENRAVVRCNEPLQLPGRVDAAKPIVFSDGNALIADIVFSPNRIQFRALSRAASRVFINERYMKGWQSDVGPFAVDPETELAYVTLPAGVGGKFAFWFAPPGLVTGLILFAAGILLSIALWRRSLERAPAGIGLPHVSSQS